MAQIDLKYATVTIKDGAGHSTSVKIGEGTLSYTEARNIEYTLDRGLLDEVREGDQIPVDVNFSFTWEYITGLPNIATTTIATGQTPANGDTTTVLTADITDVCIGRTFVFAGQTTVRTCTNYVSGTRTITFTPALATGALPVAGDNLVFFSVITVEDALKKINAAANWVSTDPDECRPYAVDIEVVYTPPCGAAGIETILLPDFRWETLPHNLRDGTIECTGKCNATTVTVTRG